MRRALLVSTLAACGGTTEPKAPPCDPTVVGDICTIAGNNTSGYSGDEGPAVEAQLSLPQDTLHAPDGKLYILDWNNHRIRSLTEDGVIHQVAGRGELGGTLDDPASSDFNHPTALMFDKTGTHLIIAAWHNSKLRTVELATGAIADLGGDGRRAYFGDEGPVATASFDLPASLAYDPAGEIVVMDQANQVLRRIDASGTVHRLAGRCVIDAAPPLGGGPCAAGVEPTACPPPSGKWTCGAMGTCSAPCTPAYEVEDGPAMNMRLGQPFGQSADPAGRIAFDAAGNLYFADSASSVIRQIDTAGNVHRIAGLAPVGGMAQSGFAGDGGPATAAKLSNPVDLAFDKDGTLVFTDVYNHCVRAIAPDKTIRTLVGICGSAGFDGDGGPALEAKLKRPYGLEIAGDVLYISDTGNNVIRQVRLR